jgi:rhodanese-related sulfurtransferase
VSASNRPTVPRALAVVAGTLGVLALAAGVSDGTSGGGRVDVDRLARTVQAEEDHVTAVELARWIRSRKPGLRVVDVRGADEFADFHVPSAENLSLVQLAHAGFRADETVVLYSEGGTHAAQGWFFLRARGLEHVYFLRGGLYEWIQQIAEPVLPDAASPREKAEWPERAALSRYFGGTPRAGGPAPPSTDGEETVALPGHTPAAGSAAASEPAAATTAAAVRRIRARGC